MSSNYQETHNQILKLAELYKEVKSVITLCEKYDPQQKLALGPLNELRNALDHIFRAFDPVEIDEKQFGKVANHLKRAAFDAYDALAIVLFAEISEIESNYSAKVISKICPKYYEEYHSEITKLNKILAEDKSNRPELKEKYFDKVNESIEKAIHIYDDIKSKIPAFERYSSEDKKRETQHNYHQYIGWIIALMIAFFSFI